MTRGWDLSLEVAATQDRWGVEQEYQVAREGRQLDFRVVLDELGRDLVCRDPGDPRARRLDSGLGLTADGWEAELVTPPLPVSPSSLSRLGRLLERGEADLVESLAGPQLTGFSTHVNVSVPDAKVLRVAEVFARTCAPLVHAWASPAERTGVLVRPRRGRLEVGTDHLTGDALLQAVALVAACARGIGNGESPPGPAATAVPSLEKFGWFVHPQRMPSLEPSLVRWADAHRAALGLGAVDLPETGSAAPDLDLGQRHRHGWSISCAWLTWEHVAWSIRDVRHDRRVYAVVPASAESGFLSALDAGLLDDVLVRALRSRVRRRLEVHRQIAGPAVWTDLRPGALVPAERLGDGSVPRVRRSVVRRLSTPQGAVRVA